MHLNSYATTENTESYRNANSNAIGGTGDCRYDNKADPITTLGFVWIKIKSGTIQQI